MKKNKKERQSFIKDKKEIIIVFLLLLIALVLRLIYLSHLKANDPSFYNPSLGTDMLTYDNYAKQILDGTFSNNKEPYYYGPLYFYFLALIYKLFGIDPYFPRLIQMILGVLTTFLTYLIAKKVFNKTVGYISLVISILYGMFYIHEGVLLMESLVTFLNILTIFLLLRVEDNPSYKNLIFSGISLGLSALARANILLFLPFILIWMLKNSKLKTQNSKLLRYGFLCLITLLTISPVTIRNYLVSGKFVLISTNGPVNLWIGNNPYAEGWFAYPPPDYSEKIGKKVEKRGDKAYIDEVLRFIKENPPQFLGLLLKKLFLFWDSTEIGDNENYDLAKEFSWILKIASLSFGFVATLALFGIILFLRVLRKVVLLYLFIFSFMISTIIFFVQARYRIAFVTILIPFCSFSIYWLYERVKTRAYKTILLLTISLILLLLLTHTRLITGIFLPNIFPHSFHLKREDKIIIRDDSGLIHGLNSANLQSCDDMIKKELIIKEDPKKFKKAIFFFNYKLFPQNIEIIFEVNGKKQNVVIDVTTRGISRWVWIRFNPNILLRGKNTVIIRPKTEKGFIFNIKIDSLYCFDRSWIFKNDQWETLKKGEYMVYLILDPEISLENFIDVGIEYINNKMYDKAIFEFQQALKSVKEGKVRVEKDDLIKIYNNMVWIYRTKGLFEEMLLVSKEIIKLNPENIQVHNNIASIYYNKGRFKEAQAECQKVLQIDPENIYAKEMLKTIEQKNFP